MPKKDWGNHKRKKEKPKFDWVLLTLVTGLSLFGLLMVYNASVVEADRVFQDKYFYLKYQALWWAIGWILMMLVSRIPYQWFEKIAAPVFLLNLFLLVLVLIPGIGSQIKGARRWLDLGVFVLQPSELIKLTFTFYLASWLQQKRRILHFLSLIVLVSLLVVLEPDLGTLVVIVSNAFLIYFLAGASLFKLIPLLLTAFGGGMAMIFSSAYRRSRLLTFLNPTRDPLGASYHISQALIALGAGGFWGLGLGQSRQKYEFLPEATTDSIFAIIGEEVGFIGSLIVILSLLVIIVRGLKLARQAADPFARILAGGIVGWLGIQILINLGAMVALLPLTGLPLPFISYGGSSLIVALVGVGVLLSISRNIS